MSEEAKKNLELLWQEIKDGRHSAVLSLCNNLSAGSPDDLDLKRVRVVALIHLDKNAEALQASQGVAGLEFEMAYCLYKQQCFREALLAIKDRNEKGFRFLRAQTISMNKEAVDEYELLLKADSDNNELKINLSASYLAPGMYDLGLSHALFMHCNDWELMFNRACALTELKQYNEALSTLRTAERIISENKDLQEEIWLIKGQIAYVFQCLQEKEKAIALYDEILKGKAEPNIKAVAKNNWVVVTGCDTKQGIKVLNEALHEENKLIGLQKVGILQNLGLLSHKKRKISEAQEAIKLCEAIDPNSERLGFFKTYVLYKDKKHEEYKRYLMEKDKPWAYGLLMKLLLEQNKHADAEVVFEALSKGKKEALDVNDYLEISNLLDKAGMTARAIDTLESACRVYQHKSLWENWGNLLRKSNKHEKCIQVFEEYLSKNNDPKIIASLVLAAASSRPEIASKWSSKLPRVNIKALYNSANAVESLDEIIDKLEYATIQSKPKGEEKAAAEVVRKKRKRKPLYPKGFDPKNPNNPKPDPERWLPKELRKEFKKKGRKKQQKMKGPQGVVLAEAQGQEVGGFNKNPSTAHTQALGEGKKKQKRKR